MILIIDNYDSFVFNLARYFEELGQETQVIRNDQITLAQATELKPSALVLSPGPCTPEEAGLSQELVRHFTGQIPILGVCLGHQSIAASLGGKIIRAPQPVHGQTSLIYHHNSRLLSSLPDPFPATRYHSLIIDEATLPAELQITARTAEGIPMAIEHQSAPLFGVQFHPESILTKCGLELLEKFLTYIPDTTPQTQDTIH
ncbi:anthranilate synthase component II [Gimesia maris]|uniref:Aminodeoxychorismate/anthranilate synthase component 2 n=1 Tax=Gimesia maris TaxID=122 RepID=A0ABX5YLI6_9PLAN|nr:aminodeoxychorismate/anthranilate synthase component II [Gimesia maris]EDL57945.1 para-aminobenzoate/anthranilate synthase glutamine amidotransferase, component II [Gimesia maris DSM 8797]QEG16477.1 Aminodeoxychorismate/anthranilate synthase component 2 [Gimesia maris]QGQ30339.1 aminodeoxychorismate/anthranilate synthase component II [Gimesia maris]|tara:strand:- start:199834 stop:200436 length:603 start_codon:yes stop_codon:yes gene_type:complete